MLLTETVYCSRLYGNCKDLSNLFWIIAIPKDFYAYSGIMKAQNAMCLKKQLLGQRRTGSLSSLVYFSYPFLTPPPPGPLFRKKMTSFMNGPTVQDVLRTKFGNQSTCNTRSRSNSSYLFATSIYWETTTSKSRGYVLTSTIVSQCPWVISWREKQDIRKSKVRIVLQRTWCGSAVYSVHQPPWLTF